MGHQLGAQGPQDQLEVFDQLEIGKVGLKGVRQGDRLSPMLFILAMDPLQCLLDQATQHGILTPLPIMVAKWRISMYADDAAIFINPIKEDVEVVKIIL